jgi:CobQ-like glutamine amidotransferase family enzyme
MSDRVGRHASEDLGETLVIPAIGGDGDALPASVRPSTGRHASRDAVRRPPGAELPKAEPPRAEPPGAEPPGAEPAGAESPDAGRSAAGQWRPPPVGEPAAESLTEPPPPQVPTSNGHGSPYGQQPRDAGHGAPQAPRDPGGEDAPVAKPRKRQAGRGGRELRLAWVYPDLLSTYGDRGNLLVLTRRAELRGFDVAAAGVNSDEPVPDDGDIYLLGGGEDLPQILAAARLRSDGGLQRAAERGAVIFAVCAGYQLMGRQFGGVEGEPVAGLSILDITSGRGERRGVGEVVADVDPALGVPRLTGFENHQGVTQIGPGARPLARVALGVGNGNGTEGAYAGNVLGSYLHGPALARNPGLADLLLSWAVGPLAPLDGAAEDWARRLREERLAATSS